MRLVIGNSMGGMHAWLWAQKYPDYMDAVVPMAAQPTAMASRNWMMRRLLIETIRQDPEYNNGNYTTQPRIVKIANVFYAIGTNGGNLALQKAAPTSALADKLIEARLAAPMTIDTNDYIYAWESSRDYDAAPGLDRIQAALLAINSADDERNPPEIGHHGARAETHEERPAAAHSGERRHRRPRHHRRRPSGTRRNCRNSCSAAPKRSM